MPIPSPQAPYDSLTADYRNKLFQEASYLSDAEQQQLETACAYAFRAHDGQTRKSGEPYITHPIAVATELARWHMDIQTLSAGLMHDVLEDTSVTKAQMATDFGDTIAEMVDGLSKLETLKFDSQAEQQAESFRKLILAMTKDVRVIIVKLSDRLHNMRTLGAKSPASRRRIATETLEVYAPIANRLGLNHVYRELQDLSFHAMHPKRYEILKRAMTTFKKNRHDVIDRVLRDINLRLVACNIEAQIRGREKNLYNIHQKMLSKKLKFEEVLDIYGFRVIVNSVPACYAALGALHSLYQPRPGKFKDYIAIPKSNGYKSLHTTLNGPYGLPIEVQIRTREMHAIAEVGVASHWAYKSKSSKEDEATLRTNQWLQNILDLQARSANAMEFLEHVKVDLFPNEVYIVTPKGKIITLPRGATPIDFAYALHSSLGDRCRGAKVDGQIVPLSTRLENGQRVEIIAAKEGHPSVNWLHEGWVKSPRAISKIRAYIRAQNAETVREEGKNQFEKIISKITPKPNQQQLCEKLGFRLLDDLFTALGQGEITPRAIQKACGALVEPAPVPISATSMVKKSKIQSGDKNGVLVDGESGLLTTLAKCCKPAPPDLIVGFVTRERGVSIHRQGCSDFEHLAKQSPEKVLPASWAALDANQVFAIDIEVRANDRSGLLRDVSDALARYKVNVTAVQMQTRNLEASMRFTLEMKKVDELPRVLAGVAEVKGVASVARI